MGATVDQVRSALMNALVGADNSTTFGEDILDNILSVALLSKFDYTKARREGLSSTIGSKVLPPMDFISDPILYDLPNILSEKGKALKTTKHIPMIGKFVYEYLRDGSGGNRRSTRNTTRNSSR
jgi:hypothetical protein